MGNTDLDRLIEWLHSVGQEYDADTNVPGIPVIITVEAGYVGFCTEFHFDENGKFQSMGAYE